MLFKIRVEKTLSRTRAKFFMKLFTNIIIHKSNRRIKINFTPVPVNNFTHFSAPFLFMLFLKTT
nr:MAG TPA: hypothetical protein [Caudoviricetes sp.]